MRNKVRWTAAFFSLSLALTGCLKSGEDATGSRSGPSQALDADHGGARIALPEIDYAALGKAGADTTRPDSVKAWFELVISGAGMQSLSYKFPLPTPNNVPFEIKGIPAGKMRSFHGFLYNGAGILTHEGITQADIQAGVFTDVRLFLAKAGGSAAVCVVIEGQKLPACAVQDTVKPPPPPPDSAGGSCWYLSSSWVSGKAKLYDSMPGGIMGILRTDAGLTLPFTSWTRHGDSLLAVLVSPTDTKWMLNGYLLGAQKESWSGVITDNAVKKTTSFSAKSLSCSVVDSGKVPDSIPVPPKPVGSIPMPGTGAKQTTLCFQMRFDYADSACEIQGYSKMDFLDGKILFGNMTVADIPVREYSVGGGSYDAVNISFYGVTPAVPGMTPDTLNLKGGISVGGTMAKGSYVRYPSGKNGYWTMSLVTCGMWIPKYPAASCSAK